MHKVIHLIAFFKIMVIFKALEYKGILPWGSMLFSHQKTVSGLCYLFFFSNSLVPKLLILIIHHSHLLCVDSFIHQYVLSQDVRSSQLGGETCSETVIYNTA